MTERTHLLSRTGDYALRAMIHIAHHGDGARVRASDLAPATGVPPHYLGKILRQLSRARLLVAQRGHHGGYALARPARRIAFCDVLHAVGLDPPRGRCTAHCVRRGPQCPLHGAYGALFQWAKSRTIAGQR
jgi:Rrf2 family protein